MLFSCTYGEKRTFYPREIFKCWQVCKYISLRDRRSRRGDTIFGAKFSIRLFRYYIKFLNKENMHTYSYGVLLYSDGRMPPLVALFADLYQFCTRYVKSNNDLCSADVLTIYIARNTRQVNTFAEHRSLLLVSCPPFSTYGLGVRYRPICSLAPVASPRWVRRPTYGRPGSAAARFDIHQY